MLFSRKDLTNLVSITFFLLNKEWRNFKKLLLILLKVYKCWRYNHIFQTDNPILILFSLHSIILSLTRFSIRCLCWVMLVFIFLRASMSFFLFGNRDLQSLLQQTCLDIGWCCPQSKQYCQTLTFFKLTNNKKKGIMTSWYSLLN